MAEEKAAAAEAVKDEKTVEAANEEKTGSLQNLWYNFWNDWASMNDVHYLAGKDVFTKDGELLPRMTTRVLDPDSPEAAAYGARLTQEVDSMSSAYAEFNAQWCPYTHVKVIGYDKKTDEPIEDIEFKKEASLVNTIYQRQMLMSAMRPLAQGLSIESISTTIGMSIGMMMMSKDFREGVGQMIRRSQLPGLEKKIEKYGLKDKYLKKEQKILAGENGGRIPYTAKSAAEQQISFMQQLYRDIRDPKMGARKETMETLTTQCMQACAIVTAMAKADGVSEESINRNMRKIADHMEHEDPAVARFFSELAGQDSIKLYQSYGDLKSITRKGETYTRTDTDIWDGQYVTADGQPFTGKFHVRMPQTKEYWKDKYAQALDMQIGAMKNGQNGDLPSPDTFTDIFPKESGEAIFHNNGSDDLAHDRDFDLRVICASVVDDTCGAEPNVHDAKYRDNTMAYYADLQVWLDKRADVLDEFQEIFDQKRDELLLGDDGLMAQWKNAYKDDPKMIQGLEDIERSYRNSETDHDGESPFKHSATVWIQTYKPQNGLLERVSSLFGVPIDTRASNYYAKTDQRGETTGELQTPENEETRTKAHWFDKFLKRDQEQSHKVQTNDIEDASKDQDRSAAD